MASHNELGKFGEELAVDYLIKKGYIIKARNWRYQKAEIDIIAQKKDVLAIIEVKTRSSLEYGTPEQFVSHKKIKLLVSATDVYVKQKDIDVNIRFDIISIHKTDTKFDIRHTKEAFLFF
ncbi:YraN family protein [Pseudofulvibacter geojedonensis]|uniref:UPF0102 protein ACFQ1O_09525 n=1 Tax=Pseudofulvibacter geojedonensis TaxID=1123758 RepID=A0ABW3I2Z3_9FLAO